MGRSRARVLLGCGVPSMFSTSHSTRMLSPPRMGSGQLNTGTSTRSEAWPSAWPVLEPSKPQMPGCAPSARILVLERSLAVGSVPSIQMYSALKLTGAVLAMGGKLAVVHGGAPLHWGGPRLPERDSQQTISRLLPVCEQQVNQPVRGPNHRPSGRRSRWSVAYGVMSMNRDLG